MSGPDRQYGLNGFIGTPLFNKIISVSGSHMTGVETLDFRDSNNHLQIFLPSRNPTVFNVMKVGSMTKV